MHMKKSTETPLLIVSRKWPPAVGGMEFYAKELAVGLQTHYKIETLVLPGRQDGTPPSLISYVLFLFRAMVFCLLHGRRYRRVIFTDLILFPAALCHWLIAPKAVRIVIVYGLDLVFFRRPGFLPLLYKTYFAFFRLSQKIFTRVISISSYTEKIASREHIRRVTTINPALPKRRLTIESQEQRDRPHWMDFKGKTILYFGRLVPRKGALWFAQSVLPQIKLDVQFLVVGRQDESDYCLNLQQCNRTHCLGGLDDETLQHLIQLADIVVMPNSANSELIDVEGFGLAAIEATSLGALLIASRTQGLADAVIDGVTGRLVEPDNIVAWTEATRESLARTQAQPERATIAKTTRERFSRQTQADAFRYVIETNRNHTDG